MTKSNLNEITVWDPLVRIFHWTLVTAFTLAYFTQEGPFEELLDQMDEQWLQTIHIWAGYVIAGLLLFRLLWGFTGPRYARFSDFVRGPRETLRYVGEVLALRAPRRIEQRLFRADRPLRHRAVADGCVEIRRLMEHPHARCGKLCSGGFRLIAGFTRRCDERHLRPPSAARSGTPHEHRRASRPLRPRASRPR